MPKQKKPGTTSKLPAPDKHRESKPANEADEPIFTDDDPDVIPDEDPFETPPTEEPPPGEGP